MNATVCPLNPPGHDWEAGLSCRWCDATRTPSEAVLSGLASVRGWSREAARTVRDAHRVEVLNEAADLFERAGRIVLDGGIMTAAEFADQLRELAATGGEKATAAAATATPDEKFFVPGRTYTRTLGPGLHIPTPIHLRFECVSLTSDPKIGDREAWGWVRRSNGTRCRDFLFDHDYPLWTPEAGEDRG